MKNNETWSKEYGDILNKLNNKNVLNVMWAFINKIEPDAAITPYSDRDKKFFDQDDRIFKRINIDGHRGPDFSSDIDILFSGCSQTYGQGVEDGTIWGEIVANNLGLTYNNLSYRGGSAMQCVYNIFNYCKKYGNPKYILCAFPPLIRSHIFVDSYFITGKPFDNVLRQRYGSDLGPYRTFDAAKRNDYIKMPAKVDEVFSNEHRVWINLMFISMLETYCKSNNIKLLWTNWIDVYNNKNPLMSTEFSNYFVLEDDWDQTIHIDETDTLKYNKCHQDIKNNYDNYFDRGTDWQYKSEYKKLGHWGAHTHIHVAENFIKEIKNRGL
jgi:hypothetical protein